MVIRRTSAGVHGTEIDDEVSSIFQEQRLRQTWAFPFPALTAQPTPTIGRMYDPRLLSNAVGEIALPLASTAWADSNMRIQLGHRLLRASGSPIVCWGCGCQCRIGLSYLCLDQEGGGLSHGRGLRGGWRAVVGDTACEGGVHHRTATGLGWHEICHRENGFDGISQGNQRRCLGSGAEQAVIRL